MTVLVQRWLLVCIFGLGVAGRAELVGSLSGATAEEEGILADKVGVALHTVAPEVQKLLVFTQCYGGNMATDPAITSLPNTAIASGTSVGEEGSSGGYDDDAARALRPGINRTGQTVHAAGVAGKYGDEHPITGGTLALSAFSLEDTRITGPIVARVVVLYLGRETGTTEWLRTLPDGTTVPAPAGQGPGAFDVAVYQPKLMTNEEQRAAIQQAFAGQPRTLVISVGRGPNDASGNYQYSADLAGLVGAITQANQFLDQYRSTEGMRQFIFFVGDHGGQVHRKKTDHRCVPGGACRVAQAQPGLPDTPGLRQGLIQTPDNIPGFELFASFAGQNVPLTPATSGVGFAEVFGAGTLRLEVESPGLTTPLTLMAREWVNDTSGDGILGNAPDEGVTLLFPVDETLLMDRLLGRTFDATLHNQSTREIHITSVAMATGSIAPLHRSATVTAPARSRTAFIAIGLVLAVLVFGLLRSFARRP